MQAVTIGEVAGERFPSGRHTRIFVGAHSPLQAAGFVSGFVCVDPGGSVPAHHHEQEEVYYILKGRGAMTVDGETREFDSIAAIYIPPEAEHSLVNVGSEPLHMLFVYAPAGIVGHWQQEREGRLA